MKKKFIAAELDSFNRMFAQLANQANTVCWMRSLDYKRQLYISPNFDSESIGQTINARLGDLTINDGNNHMFFRIGSKDGNVHYLRDWSILIYNKIAEPIAIAGVGEKISPEHWYSAIQSNKKSPTAQLPGGLSLNEILEKEATLQSISLDSDTLSQDQNIKLVNCIRVNNLTIPLSKREADCLYHLRLGKSAKDTGRILCISPRTVETHIDTIKQKACVKTKLELITQLVPVNTSIVSK
jgi:DNA-binding CsgD family transcriptional regulator